MAQEDKTGLEQSSGGLQSLADSIRKDISGGGGSEDRDANLADPVVQTVPHQHQESAHTFSFSHFLKEMFLIIYSIIPGSVSGLLIIYMSTLIAVMAFFYDMHNLFYQGMFTILLATCLATIPIALISRFPGISPSVSNTNAVLIGLLMYVLISEGSITYEAGYNNSMELLISMAVVGFSVAGMFFLVGVMRISRIFAFAPEVIFATVQVVVAMMIIVISYSLLSGEVVTNWPTFLAHIDIEFFNDSKVRFALGVGISMALIISMFSSHLVMPILIVISLLGFHLWTRGFLQMETQDLIAQGWLLPMADADISNFVMTRDTWEHISSFEFNGLRTHLTDIVVICFVLLITSLEINRRLEETVETYIHPAHEITAASFSSIFSTFFSGFSVQHSYTPTVVSNKLGGHKRSASLAAGAICGVFAVFFLEYLRFVPIPLIVATMINFATLYFIKWLIKGTRTLDFIEYVLVVIALLLTIFLGHNAGLIFGLLSGAVVFMLTHSQISGIKRILSGKLYHSSTERLPQLVKLLDTYGDSILIIQLESTLVYGMMYEIIHMVVGRNNDQRYNPLGYILLDFSAVRNIDVTVLDQMNGLFEVSEHHGILIVACGLHHQHAELFKQIGFLNVRRRLNIKIMPTLNTSLEWCEDDLLRTIAAIDKKVVAFDFDSWLAERLGDEESYGKLLSYMQEEVLQAEETISQQYDTYSDKLYFIKSGSVDVTLDVPNQERVYLRKLKEGALIGELGFYLGIKRNVNITALQQTVVMTLDRKTLVKISKDDPQLMLALHRFMVIYLSTRVAYNNRMLQVLIASDNTR